MPYLDPFAGPWTKKEARHLLVRTTFGPSNFMVETAVSDGLASTINKLFTLNSLPSPPLKSIPDGTGGNQLNDPGATYGNTWVNADPFPNVSPPMFRNRVLRSRSKSLYSWTFLQIFNSGTSIREKLTLFWHDHFVVGNSTIGHREYLYYDLLRKHSLGNFKTLTEEITIDTNMLLYLSGSENTNVAPNENYAREILELFTIGKGPLVAPGDYTNYTETDIEEIAKVLTGWRVAPISNPSTLTATFDNTKHTTGSKTLSHRFGNAVIAENGAQEYKDLIDVIFQQVECSKYIMRQLYKWFVSDNIDSDIETNIIIPLATLLRTNNYEITPVLKVLFQSEHFYDSVACMIKSPIDLIMSASRGLDIVPPTTSVEEEYDHVYNYYAMCAETEQELFHHPDVAGWKAYYQEPQFYKLWINNLLLPKRHEFCRLMVEGGTFSYVGTNYWVNELVPVLDIVDNIPGAQDINVLLAELTSRMFAYSLTTSQLEALKDILIPGLPDFEWTVDYSAYRSYPANMTYKTTVENKLKKLFSTMVRMSEFQIM